MEEITNRESVVAVIINENKKVMMCEHRWIDDAFQFPQGGIEENETEEDAILRELFEELGSKKFYIIDRMDEIINYTLPKKYNYHQERQRFFLIYYYGKDDEIHFDNQEKPEFKFFKWVELDEPIKNVIYFKKISYSKAIDFFSEKIKSLSIEEIHRKIKTN